VTTFWVINSPQKGGMDAFDFAGTYGKDIDSQLPQNLVGVWQSA
jgi:hypothetical protein